MKSIKITLALGLLLLSCGSLGAEVPCGLQHAAPAAVGMDPQQLAYADTAIRHSIEKGDIPGAVLAVVRGDKIALLKAYGNKQVYPDTLPMTTNTVFDLASVSKAVSTTISAMILVERGQLRLTDAVTTYIPPFQAWKNAEGEEFPVRVVELMTHTSGLPAYASVEELQKKYTTPNPEGMMTYISEVKRSYAPGTAVRYSCLNFITLQHIIETISGMSLQEFARENIFVPLGMAHTDYNPTGETLAWTAPTEVQPDGSVLRGQVHDPLARVMNGGVSGNAGVFSNAEDLATLAAMLLGRGEVNGVRILSPLTVETMSSVPEGFEKFGRALGWDVCSGYAKDGDLFGKSAYGHTGYTGTSITIDPATNTAVILLAHRVHPKDTGSVSRLRDQIANIVAASIVEL